ncbi:MAG: cupin [Chloroflexi bacterium]|nr:MAG: cupin [Chloroflexota bacterium]
MQTALQVIRWQEKVAPSEQELRKRMQQDGLSPYTWSNGSGYQYAVHSHGYQKVLYCVHGSIRFFLPDSPDAAGNPSVLALQPGDCMILPTGVRHSAQVGEQGVTCLEAARH